jgi:DNA-directed RNA polymerase subunit RPC12/RpoP
MRLDSGAIFKRSVFCSACKEEYLFTLRAIADNSELKCFGCGSRIDISDSAYEPLLRDVKATLDSIQAT